MLPVCSATTCCSGHTKVSFINCNNVDKVVWNSSNGVHLDVASFERLAASCSYSNYIGSSKKFVSMGMSLRLLNQNGLRSIRHFAQNSYQVGVIDEPHHLGPNSMISVDSSSNFAADDPLMDFIEKTIDNTETLPNYADVESVTTSPVSNSSNIDLDSIFGRETNFADIVSKMNESIAVTINGGENVLNNLFDSFTSSLTTTFTNANEAVDDAINEIISFVNKSGESAGSKLSGLSSELKEASGRAGPLALDVLRGTIIVVEDSLIQGLKTVGHAYSFVKKFLPPDIQEALSLSEESVEKVLSPAGTAFRQVYSAVEGFEESLNLDPSDPLIPFVLFLGLSATIWGSYRITKYSGYSGDLSPESALELLQENDNVVLVDVRPENIRERDGIPDLRRAARFRYVSVTLPKVDGSVKKLLKRGRDVEDSLLAAVIRNLKIVDDGSKVLVMDADGTRSKGIARSLRKLGTKRPYLVQGGFRSWVKNSFPVKELKPETALTILNEEAEAILEEINPTPLKILGYGVGLVAAVYSLAEWEKTLQLIGVIGLSQSIYRRVASYEDVEDLKQDVRLLLTPFRVGGQVILWVAGKLETNRNGLPTLPSSSSDVQSRVLQAAAKHESQLSDTEETEDSLQTESSGDENVHISESYVQDL